MQFAPPASALADTNSPSIISPQEVIAALSRLLPIAVQIAVFADGGVIGWWSRHLDDVTSAMGGALYRMANHYVAAGCHPGHLRMLLELQARQRSQLEARREAHMRAQHGGSSGSGSAHATRRGSGIH